MYLRTDFTTIAYGQYMQKLRARNHILNYWPRTLAADGTTEVFGNFKYYYDWWRTHPNDLISSINDPDWPLIDINGTIFSDVTTDGIVDGPKAKALYNALGTSYDELHEGYPWDKIRRLFFKVEPNPTHGSAASALLSDITPTAVAAYLDNQLPLDETRTVRFKYSERAGVTTGLNVPRATIEYDFVSLTGAVDVAEIEKLLLDSGEAPYYPDNFKLAVDSFFKHLATDDDMRDVLPTTIAKMVAAPVTFEGIEDFTVPADPEKDGYIEGDATSPDIPAMIIDSNHEVYEIISKKVVTQKVEQVRVGFRGNQIAYGLEFEMDVIFKRVKSWSDPSVVTLLDRVTDNVLFATGLTSPEILDSLSTFNYVATQDWLAGGITPQSTQLLTSLSAIGRDLGTNVDLDLFVVTREEQGVGSKNRRPAVYGLSTVAAEALSVDEFMNVFFSSVTTGYEKQSTSPWSKIVSGFIIFAALIAAFSGAPQFLGFIPGTVAAIVAVFGTIGFTVLYISTILMITVLALSVTSLVLAEFGLVEVSHRLGRAVIAFSKMGNILGPITTVMTLGANTLANTAKEGVMATLRAKLTTVKDIVLNPSDWLPKLKGLTTAKLAEISAQPTIKTMAQGIESFNTFFAIYTKYINPLPEAKTMPELEEPRPSTVPAMEQYFGMYTFCEMTEQMDAIPYLMTEGQIENSTTVT